MPDDMMKALQGALKGAPSSKEMEFRNWYAKVYAAGGAPADPNSPEAKYDYRRAFEAGVPPGKIPEQYSKATVRSSEKGGPNIQRIMERADDIEQDTVGKTAKE